MRSACQQDAEKQGGQRAGAGEGTEDRKPCGTARAGVQGCRDTRHQYRGELGDQCRPVTSGDLSRSAAMFHLPVATTTAKAGHAVWLNGRAAARGTSAPRRHSTGTSAASVSWPPTPDGGSEHVQEQPDRVGADSEHSCGYPFRLGIPGGMPPTMAALEQDPFRGRVYCRVPTPPDLALLHAPGGQVDVRRARRAKTCRCRPVGQHAGPVGLRPLGRN